MQNNSVIWTAPAKADVVHFCLGDLISLFDKTSGQTHLLSEAAFEIVTLVQKQPLSTPDIVKKMQEQFSFEGRDDPVDTLKAHIHELDDLGLLHPVL